MSEAPPQVGVPVKVLREAEGYTITIETNTKDSYKGRLIEAEDNLSCTLNEVVVTSASGRVNNLENVYIRGNKIRLLILPEQLKTKAIFHRQAAERRGGGGRGFGRGGRGGRGGRPRFQRRY